MKFIIIIFSLLFFSCSTINKSVNKFNKEGKKEGCWVEYSNDSTFIELIKYKKGIKHGIYKKYTIDNNLIIKGRYLNGLKNGKFTTYTGVKYLYFIRLKGSVIYYINGNAVKSKTYNSRL